LIPEKRTFNVRVCVEALLVSMTTSPSGGMRSNGGSVWIHVKEEHDAIHSVTWEIRELGQGIKDILSFCDRHGIGR